MINLHLKKVQFKFAFTLPGEMHNTKISKQEVEKINSENKIIP